MSSQLDWGVLVDTYQNKVMSAACISWPTIHSARLLYLLVITPSLLFAVLKFQLM